MLHSSNSPSYAGIIVTFYLPLISLFLLLHQAYQPITATIAYPINGRFPGESWTVGFPHVLHPTCPRREALGLMERIFLTQRISFPWTYKQNAFYLQVHDPSCQPTVSVKSLKETQSTDFKISKQVSVAYWLAEFVARTKLTHVGPGQYLDGWPSSGGYTISVCNKPTRQTQPCIPSGSLIRVPTSAGVMAGMSPPSGGR